MKKLFIILLIISSCFIYSCKDNKKDPLTTLEVLTSSIKEVYYTDEFNITTISMKVTKAEVEETISLTPLMIENYPDELVAGTYVFKVTYDNAKTEFSVNFIERDFYTEGLEFVLNKTQDAYLVSSYNGTDKTVIIPQTYNYLNVEGIKTYAFNNNNNIEKVVLPNTIKEIEANAFANSTLKEINIPESVKKIKEAAFYNCTSLRSVTIPSSVKTIEKYAFTHLLLCYTDTTDTSSWDSGAFDDNLIYIHKGLDLSKIEKDENFEYYVEEKVSVLNYIGDSNTALIPDTYNDKIVNVISHSAFLKLSNLENVTIGNNIEIIESKAFRETSISFIEIPSSVKEIGVYSFSGCEALEEVKFNEGLEIIRMSAFAACNHLLVAILPSTLHTIEQYGFQNCLKIKTIYIPKSVTSIGEYAFYACHYATLYIEASSIPSTWHNNFNPSKAKNSFNATKDTSGFHGS